MSLTLTDVRQMVAEIVEKADDDEMAHSLEDDLFLEIVRHHAQRGCPLAKEAMKSRDVDFARWTA